MPEYAGRTNQLPETLFFGGINRQSTILNIRDGEAYDIQNYDIIRGSLTVRQGYNMAGNSGIGAPLDLYDIYTRQDGQQVHVVVGNGRFFESTSAAGPYTDRSNGLTVENKSGANGTPCLGVAFGNGYVVSSGGLHPPAYSRLGYGLVTLEDASLLDPPTGLSISTQGTSGATIYYYVVTALTGRGETIVSGAAVITTGNATLGTTNFNRITWNPVLGANGGYRVYRYDSGSGTYKALAIGTSLATFTTATTVDDTGLTYCNPTINPPTSNTAYNTPQDWNDNGFPEGFAAIAVGKDQRLLAWRGYNAWVSAANNCLDWLTTGADGAFTFPVYGGINNSIKAAGVLYDLTCIFTPTNGFFYTGTSATDFTLSRIQGTGCISPKSLHLVENDLLLWSQYGPTSVQRILSGADVAATNISDKIRPIINDETDRDYWWMISAFNDPNSRRSVWLYKSPSSALALNDSALVLYYNHGGWSKYTDFCFQDGNVDQYGSVYYGGYGNVSAVTSPAVFQEGGASDQDGAGNSYPIDSSFVSAWYDLRTWTKKRMAWLDMIADATIPNYSFGVQIQWDYGRNNTTQAHTLTNTTTDGRTLLQTYAQGTMHRVYTLGQGQSFQFTITSSTNGSNPSMLGFRPDARAKGVR